MSQIIFDIMKKVEAPVPSGKAGNKVTGPSFPNSHAEWADFQLSDQVA